MQLCDDVTSFIQPTLNKMVLIESFCESSEIDSKAGHFLGLGTISYKIIY